MSKDQLLFLEEEYQKQPNWSLAHTKSIAQGLDLDRVKVYKWHYDRKRRDKAELDQAKGSGQYSSDSV